MGKLTTHVLDTMHGVPAAGLRVALHRLAADDTPHLLATAVLDADGRTPKPLLADTLLTPGRYRLVFELGAYFRARGAALAEPAFLDRVPVDFGVADAAAHLHVPLLASPWAYSTYRGS